MSQKINESDLKGLNVITEDELLTGTENVFNNDVEAKLYPWLEMIDSKNKTNYSAEPIVGEDVDSVDDIDAHLGERFGFNDRLNFGCSIIANDD